MSIEELDTHIAEVKGILDSLQTVRDLKASQDTTGKYVVTTDIESLFENRRIVTIKGKVDSSSLISSLRIIQDRPYQPDFIQSIHVSEDGSFSDEFEIETNGLFELRFKDHSHDIYLENGKTIGIIVDTLLGGGMRFIGDLSAENNYLMSSHSVLSDHHIDYENNNQVSPDEFAAYVENEINQLHESLDSIQGDGANSIAKDFSALMDQKLNLTKSRSLLGFARARTDTILTNDYFHPEGIDLNSADIFHLFEFRKYLFEYFEYVASKTLSKEALYDATHPAYFESKYGIIDSLFSITAITDFLKTDVIFESIAKVRHTGINSLVKHFQSDVTNLSYLKTINDRYKSIVMPSNGTLAPELTGVTFDGEDFKLSELRGKYVYIFVWATWCGPCKVEIPFYEQMLEDYGDENIVFVGISVDKDKRKWIDSFLFNDYPGLQVLIPGDWNSALVKDYQIASIPQFILINPEGEIAALQAERPTKAIKAQLSQYGMFAKVY